MSELIHDHEVDTGESTVRALLLEQCREWADAPLTDLATTGTTNRLWRVHTGSETADIVLRLPRQTGAAGSIERELDLLPRLAATTFAELVAIPEVAHHGRPSPAFSLPWMACRWLGGTDAWARRDRTATDTELAGALGEAVRHLRSLTGLALEPRSSGQRGGPLAPVLDRIEAWISAPEWNAGSLIDVDRVRTLLVAARDHETEDPEPTVLHGDLLPGNVLLDADGRFHAIIDWGGAGLGDPAEDVAPAWSIFEGRARERFRTELGVDDATWARARAIELEHAVGGVLYYRPRRHPLGDVMARTLDRILHDR